jgi:N6-adenosine-specific RNA methylase IME4
MTYQANNTPGTDLVVAKLEPACRMLVEARDAQAAKRVADLARAAEIYAQRQKLGEEAERYAHAVLIDAMTLMGEYLKEPGAKQTGGDAQRTRFQKSTESPPPPTLASLGIGKKSSANGQALVEIQNKAPELYAKVRSGDLTIPRARQEHARQREAATPRPTHTPEVPVTTYRCIVADPPWPMQKSERSPRPDQGPATPYKTMSLEAIEALPVRELVDPTGCHFYLWVTHRFLPDGLRILAAWGFTYHCLLTWVKPTGMTPFSWMFNTEHVLFGYCGKFRAGKQGLKVSFEAPAPRGSHSAKPEIFYERACEFSDGPRLAMFERRAREGFDVWGNEL